MASARDEAEQRVLKGLAPDLRQATTKLTQMVRLSAGRRHPAAERGARGQEAERKVVEQQRRRTGLSAFFCPFDFPFQAQAAAVSTVTSMALEEETEVDRRLRIKPADILKYGFTPIVLRLPQV